ncbi:MAG TPA: ABC transporter substrate-binding protein [Stellaceae bacterium]|jgi:phospholipid transport system substrate-binding protein|nr:ABC transporter substrate-binding protein [Stellaceae bacterium]
MSWLWRRHSVIRVIAFVGLVAGSLTLSISSPAAAAGPSDTIRQFYAELLDTMQHAAQLGPRGRYQKLEAVVFRSFDVPFMARLSIGSEWAGLNPDQKKRAARAYGRYVAAVYATRFDGYSGERLEVTGEQKVRRGTIVNSRIVKSDGEPVAINYLVHDNLVGYQIRDVYLSGTISELATRRSEFATLLRSGGIDGLIAALNKKADDLQG